jgi:hypothetical protein
MADCAVSGCLRDAVWDGLCDDHATEALEAERRQLRADNALLQAELAMQDVEAAECGITLD